MIQIIPSISILNGKIVRLKQGDYTSETAYKQSPIDLARRFQNHGVEVVHLVDLDGARKGEPVNYHIIEDLAGHTDLKIDYTGGIHTDGDIIKAYEYGASYITVASLATSNKKLFGSWMISYGREKITLGADVLNEKIAVEGWQKNTTINLYDHIKYFYKRGLKYVKTTDILRDGVMEGPAFDLYEEIIRRFPGICVLASGGVRNADDVERLNDMGVFAVIIGRALYEHKLSLSELEKYMVTKAD